MVGVVLPPNNWVHVILAGEMDPSIFWRRAKPMMTMEAVESNTFQHPLYSLPYLSSFHPFHHHEMERGKRYHQRN